MAHPLVVILTAFFGVPVATSVHELGHAVVALRETSGWVVIRVGRERTRLKLRFAVGRLAVIFSPIGSGGVCFHKGIPTRRGALGVVAAGPAASLALAAGAGLAGLAAEGAVGAALLTLAAVAAYGVVLTLLPFQPRWTPASPGRPSDGLVILCLLRGRPVPAPRRAPTGPSFRSPGDTQLLRACLLSVPVGGLMTEFGFVLPLFVVTMTIALQSVLAGALARPRPAPQAQPLAVPNPDGRRPQGI